MRSLKNNTTSKMNVRNDRKDHAHLAGMLKLRNFELVCMHLYTRAFATLCAVFGGETRCAIALQDGVSSDSQSRPVASRQHRRRRLRQLFMLPAFAYSA